jgi:Icc-related predicted phosphoesterase
MKLLAAADLHGSQYRLNILLDNIENYAPNLVVLCGDITQFGPGKVAKNFLNQIPIDTLAIIGNIDTIDVNDSINESKAENLHLKKVERNNISFIGIGGILPIPLLQTFIYSKTTEKPLKEMIDKNTILITHEPPYKTKDRVFFGHHAGNKELRDLVEQYLPKLVLCGHIHEDPGFTKVNNCVIVNCSMGKRTEGALIEINDGINVQILD